MKEWIASELDSDDVKFTKWERWSMLVSQLFLIPAIIFVLSSDGEVLLLKVVGVCLLVQSVVSITNATALSRIEKRLYVVMRIMYERD